jgi:hypothetical protein
LTAEVGLELVDFWFKGPDGYPAAFDAMRGAGAEALLIVPTPETVLQCDYGSRAPT